MYAKRVAWAGWLLVLAAAAGGAAELSATLQWDAPGADVDLVVLTPDHKPAAAAQDVRSGPGKETVTIPNPAPGAYAVAAIWRNMQPGARVAILATVAYGDQPTTVIEADLTERKVTLVLTTVQVGGEPGVAADLRQAGDVVAKMKWGVQGTDLDLVLVGPDGTKHRPLQDAKSGPGEETVVLKAPAPGLYHVVVAWSNDRPNLQIPVTVNVTVGGRPLNVFQGTLDQEEDVRDLGQFQVGQAADTKTPPAAAGDIAATLKWQMPGIDLDVVIAGPNDRKFEAANDVATGPGQETALVQNPAPGAYKVVAVWSNDMPDIQVPATLEVSVGGRPAGVHQVTLTQKSDVQDVTTVNIGQAGPPPVGVGVPLTAVARWETPGADVDLVLIGPDERKYGAATNVASGPGQETVLLRNPAPGRYKVVLILANRRRFAGVQVPVTVELRRGDEPCGTMPAILDQQNYIKFLGLADVD